MYKKFSFSIFMVVLAQLVLNGEALRCQCTTDKSGVGCHNGWCQVFNNGTSKVAACVMLRIGSIQHFACSRVSVESGDRECRVENRKGRDVTVCWCKTGDYCNVDLADTVDDDSPANSDNEEDEGMVVEKEYDVNDNREIDNYDLSGEIDTNRPKSALKPPSEDDLPPWKRMNPVNSRSNQWVPPPPPPAPPAVVKMSTTTTTTRATTTTTERASYDEEVRRRKEEYERRMLEYERESEQRRREQQYAELQYEARRHFGDVREHWPVPPIVVPSTTTTSTTTSTTTTTTQRPTTTTITATTTTTAKPPVPNRNYAGYYHNRNNRYNQYRRPLDLNPEPSPTPIQINNFSAIVYPPQNFRKAVKGTTTTSTTSTTTTTTTTEAPSPTTTTTAKTTTELPTTTRTTTPPPPPLPRNEKIEDGKVEKEMHEMPPSNPEYEEDGIIMYTPKPREENASEELLAVPRRTPPVKIDKYRKILETTSSPDSCTRNFSLFSTIIFTLFIIFLI